MYYSTLLYLLLSIAVTLKTVKSSCAVQDKINNCEYTINCIGYAERASLFDCHDKVYLTFEITKSYRTSLNVAFFSSTNFDSRVREIKAFNNSWDEIDEQAFKYFGKTLKIYMSNNEIKTIKDQVFTNLDALQYLDLSNNKIEELYPKAFMISSSRDPELAYLDLSSNFLTSLKDNLFNQLVKLQTLVLNNNRISVLESNCFYGLINLKQLSMYSNSLQSLNITLISLTKLDTFDVHMNSLIAIRAFDFSRLTLLTTVNMSYNSISTIDSSSFEYARDLNKLDLQHNKIKAISNTTFVNNIRLFNLDVSNNNITILDENSFRNTNISVFNIENNFIAGDITRNTFLGLNISGDLNLYNQNFSSIQDYAFQSFEYLLTLNLSSNNINSVASTSFSNSSLITLDISHNKITNLNFVKDNFPYLTKLHLSYNKITIIPQDIFSVCEKLVLLDVSFNNIKTVEPNSIPLSNLQYLFIHGNELNGVIEENTFSPARYLRSLDISGFKLTKLNKSALIDLPVLTRLNASHNKIEKIYENNFIGMNNMFDLDLSFNKLELIDFSNSSLRNLKALYINNNLLKNISNVFNRLVNLTYLDVSRNFITDLNEFSNKNLPNIQVLGLSNNNITYFNNIGTNSLFKLLSLDLSSNYISNINLSYYKNLMVVNLSNNLLKFINSTSFGNLHDLRLLDLSFNRIKDLTPGIFHGLNSLVQLNLSSNHIADLHFGSFSELHKMEVLDLSNNTIATLDEHIFHDCPGLLLLIIDNNQIKYIDIDTIVNITHIRTLSVGGNPIACKEVARAVKKMKNSNKETLTVTSLSKVYYEDNVHGIKCGISKVISTTTKPIDEYSSSDLLTILCFILGGLLILVILAVVTFLLIYNHNRNKIAYEHRNSLNLSVSGCQDLLE